jgi:hypothetical protein
MTKSAPKFNVSDVKCNGAGSYASLISEDNYNAIQTYVSVYRKVEDFRDLIVEMAQKTKEDALFGSRCMNDRAITDRIATALGDYAMGKWENIEALAEMWINAQIAMFTGSTMTALVKDALRDCASADYWYAFEKDWN